MNFVFVGMRDCQQKKFCVSKGQVATRVFTKQERMDGGIDAVIGAVALLVAATH
jgi:hypothetical protein